METAIIYSRVSTKEQGERGFSLPDQEDRLTTFANRLGWRVVGQFQDDFTGTTFDRPGFNRLLEFAKTQKPNYVIFTKWSRFSRNTADAYQMIRKLKAQGIKVQAIDEQIDFSIPQNQVMLAIHLAMPQVDNEMRFDTTRRGTIQANQMGRYTGMAPTGYKNARGEDKKPIIVPDDKAHHVVRAFELIASGIHSQRDAVKLLEKEGIKLTKSRIAKVLRNQVYIGNIVVPAYKSEPEKIVKGIHSPIISESLFYKVQDILDGKKRDKVSIKPKVNPQYPLKGFLYCTEDHKMTGSCSHGHGGAYHYYHCQNNNKCERYQASAVNDTFIDELRKVQVDQGTAEDVIETLTYFIKPSQTNTRAIQAKIIDQEREIEQLIDNRIRSFISPDDYNRTRTRYEANLATLNNQLNAILNQSKNLSEDLDFSLQMVQNMALFYTQAPPEERPRLLSSIISGKMVFDGNTYRTIEWNPFIQLLANSSKASRGSLTLENNQYGDLPRVVAGKGQVIEPFKLISSINQLAETFKLLRA